VAHDGARERPADLGPAEASIVGVGQEIAIVVPEDEAVLERGREDRDGERAAIASGAIRRVSESSFVAPIVLL
jgi:hypothetical protein